MSSLIITKQTGNFFSLVLDGGSAIISEQNRLTTIGNFCNFKTANGANLILKQNILYSEITIITGVSHVPTSINDLWVSLIAAGFFDGVVTAGGGSPAMYFTDLLDTFASYIGRDGQVLVVNESMQRIETVAISMFSAADREKLDTIETGAQANVNPDWDKTDPSDPATILNKPPDFGTIATPVIMDGIIGVTIGFVVGQQDFEMPVNAVVTDVYINDGKQSKTTVNNTARLNRWSQVDTTLSITKVPALNNYIYIEYMQL